VDVKEWEQRQKAAQEKVNPKDFHGNQYTLGTFVNSQKEHIDPTKQLAGLTDLTKSFILWYE